MAHKPLTTVADLTLDAENANRGTERGRGMLETSLRQYGAGRSVLADRHGRLIAGNKTVEVAAELGLPIRTVETDGTELVVVRRRDLDLVRDPAARELAYADNRVGQVSLDWDLERIAADVEVGTDLSALWGEHELANILTVVSSPEGFDPAAEWRGMPAFEHEDRSSQAAFTISVFLKDSDDLAAFGQLLGKDLTGRKFVWFSKQPHGDLHEVYDEMPT